MPKASDDTHPALPPIVADEEDVELLCWLPEDGEGEGDEEFDDELPADEAAFDAQFPDDAVDEDLDDDDEVTQGGAPALVDLTPDEYELRRRATLPQPDRARSAPDLPRVKASAFKRLIK